MNEEKKKVVPVPAEPGPVVSQANPAPATATAVPAPPDAPIVLSQVPPIAWSGVNLPKKKPLK